MKKILTFISLLLAAVLAAALLLAALLVAALFATGILAIPEKPREFTSERWASEPTKRIHMVVDLMDKYEFIGMGKEDILSLLGDPIEVSPGYPFFNDYDDFRSNSMQNTGPKADSYAEANCMFYPLVEYISPSYVPLLYIEMDENDVTTGVYMVSLTT